MSTENNANRTAIYVRLSKDSEESESIQNQKLLLIDYAMKQDFIIYKIYVDENYSGLDNNRPAFRHMISDAEKGFFDIILCKTQSRFTRDMEVFEKYVHELFALWGIRFISVVDHTDSNTKSNKKSRQINALINEWYCEDLSENIRAVLKRKMKEGQFVGAFACYGYQKSKIDKHQLVIDKEAAEVVKKIFDLCLEGHSCRKIADILTKNGIMTPTMYKKSKGIAFQNPNANQKNKNWSYNTVKKILRNECYTGCLVQGKEYKISYKYKNRILAPKQNWIVVPKSHEAIIDKKTFDAVQNILNHRQKNSKK